MVFWYGVLQRTIVDLSMVPSCYIYCFHFLDIRSRSIWWYLNGTILQGFHPGQFLPTPQMWREKFGRFTTSAYVRGFWITPLPTKPRYCWWLKSCTTKNDDYPIIYRVSTIPGGAGLLPSTVALKNLRCQTFKHPRYALQHRTTLRFVHQP